MVSRVWAGLGVVLLAVVGLSAGWRIDQGGDRCPSSLTSHRRTSRRRSHRLRYPQNRRGPTRLPAPVTTPTVVAVEPSLMTASPAPAAEAATRAPDRLQTASLAIGLVIGLITIAK